MTPRHHFILSAAGLVNLVSRSLWVPRCLTSQTAWSPRGCFRVQGHKDQSCLLIPSPTHFSESVEISFFFMTE